MRNTAPHPAHKKTLKAFSATKEMLKYSETSKGPCIPVRLQSPPETAAICVFVLAEYVFDANKNEEQTGNVLVRCFWLALRGRQFVGKFSHL
jgi:hypothetical protein